MLGEPELHRVRQPPVDPLQPEQVVELHDAVRRCSFEQDVEQVSGRQCVFEGAMRRVVIEAEVGGERGEPAVGHLVTKDASGDAARVDGRAGEGIEALTVERDIEEAEVEADVVADDDRTGGELHQRRDDGFRSGSAADERVGDAGEVGDAGRDRPAGVDEGPERAEADATLDDGGTDLGDRVVDARSAGGLDVEHAEPDVDQRRVRGGERHRAQCGRTDVRWQGEWVAGRRLGNRSVGTMTV